MIAMAAFNPYFPATYQSYAPYMAQTPYQNAQNAPVMQQNAQGVQVTPPAQTAPQTANNGLVWVQGIEGAKAHATVPGVPALLMDSESERFFIKTVDASGMPMPLRVFEYHEVTETQKKHAPDMSGYVTREEFEQYKESVSGKAAKLTDE